MIKHTPGPWRLDRHSALIPLVPYEWAEAYGGSAANARLIAAAPDMLDVLLRAKDVIEALDGTSTDNEKLVDDYRAVLAKVEGTK
jgi:hypothetical protein